MKINGWASLAGFVKRDVQTGCWRAKRSAIPFEMGCKNWIFDIFEKGKRDVTKMINLILYFLLISLRAKRAENFNDFC